MFIRRSLNTSISVLVLLGLAAAALLAAVVPPASADTQPTSTSTPATVSTDPLPTVQIDGVVWSQVVVGTTVYVGGQFTEARPAGAAPGTSTVARSNFLAYDITTGELLGFAPSFNAQVRSLAVSPDNSTLYVAGQFTSAGGQARYRLAAFDVASGALKTGFTPNLNSSVYDVAVTESTVYAVGIFTTANGATRTNAAALNVTNGSTLAFSVTPTGGTVRRVAVSPDRSKVVLGGTFTKMNGSSNPGYGLAMVNSSTGTNLAMPVNSVVRDAGTVGSSSAGITSLVAAADGFYGTGFAFGQSAGNLEGTFKADWNGKLIWIEDCHGDTYSAAVTGAVVYVAGHPHDCARIGGFPDTTSPVEYHRGLAFTAARTGTLSSGSSPYYNFGGQPAPTLLHWFPDIAAGTYTGQSQGPWQVAATTDYVVYGGEFPSVNGKAQQGLVRFARAGLAPNTDGPRLGGSSMGFTASASSGSIRLSLPADYDRDNTRLTYKFYRNGVVVSQTTADSNFWTRPTVSYTDRAVTKNQTYNYYVRAADPYGRSRTSTTVSVKAR